jgi:hypothetical protein
VAEPPLPPGDLLARYGPHLQFTPPGGWGDERVHPPDRLVKTHCCFCGQQIGVIRGSATISRPPLSRQRHRYWVVIGAHSATLAPITNATSACAMSSHGLGERSTPNASL